MLRSKNINFTVHMDNVIYIPKTQWNEEKISFTLDANLSYLAKIWICKRPLTFHNKDYSIPSLPFLDGYKRSFMIALNK